MPRLSLLERTALGAFASYARGRLGARLAALTLFGSRARGEGRDDSDLDVLVLVRDLRREERRALIDAAADIGLAHELVLSPLVLDAASWSEALPLSREVARDGVAL